MKTLKLLFVALFATLLLVSCEKDEDGQRIKYYDKPTGEGYVFYRHYKINPDSISPASNICLKITHYYTTGGELFGTVLEHTDEVFTNNYGKYSFNFLKTINGKRCNHWSIRPITPFETTPVPTGISVDGYENIKDAKIIYIDTFLVNVHKY